MCIFKIFHNKKFSPSFRRVRFHSQKILTLIGGTIPQEQLSFRDLSTEKTFKQLFHRRQKTNKRPSYSLCKMTSTNYSTSVFLACGLTKCRISLSEVSETKQTLLKSAYSIARGQPQSTHTSSKYSEHQSGFSNVLANNTSKGRAQACHGAHVKKSLYIFHRLIQDTHRNRPRRCWTNSWDRKEPPKKK